MSEYGINSISSLTFREGVRSRIQMYLGSDDIEGVYQALKEIINNSTDEALAGYGKKIEIKLDENNGISVRDYGRGVPFGIRENGENVLVSIYTQSHTGGKFNHDSYKNASGLNGVGGSCVCLSSKSFIVRSFRDGKMAEASFTKGELDNYKEGITKEKNGTYVWFIPDEEVFSNGEIAYSYDRICKDIKDISYLYNGISFTVESEGKKAEYCAKNGILDFVEDNVKKPLHKHIIYSSATDGKDSVEIAFQWGCKRETPFVFVNGLRCPEGGTPVTGAKSAITKTFNSLADESFDGDKIRENLFYVMNCKVENPSFANQTKSKINNSSLRTLASNAFTNALKEMSVKYASEFSTIVELLRNIEKAEAAAEKARNAVLQHEAEMTQAKKQKIIDSNKLRDAKKLGEDSILLCVEGLSAGGSMSIGRSKAENGDKIGILMLRGKCINALSNPIEEVLQNEEVKLLLQALGLTYGKKYNSSKLRYGKIAISSDSDSDGSHIGLLIMAILQKLAPEIIQENRLYWLRAPIYKVENGKKVSFYYSEEEFKNHEKGNIIKYKGLGQMDEQDLRNSLFSAEWQHLEQIVTSEEGLTTLLELMGEDISPRKEFVQKIDFGGFDL